jgi:sigma-B regulation protein RsbU (phosphoserine phosphatase)
LQFYQIRKAALTWEGPLLADKEGMEAPRQSPPQESIPVWRSIRTRLSGVLVLFCLCVVLFVSWHNSQAFERFLGLQIEDTLVRQARFAGDGIAAHLAYTSTQTVALAERLATEPPGKYTQLMRALMAGDKDIRALAFMTIRRQQPPEFLARASTSNVPPELWTALTEAARGIGKNRQAFVDLEPAVRQPHVALLMRFAQGANKPHLVLATVIDKAKLMERLDATGGATVRLVDDEGTVIVGPAPDARGRRDRSQLVKSAQKATNTYGFRRDYAGASGQRLLGAFAKVTGYDVLVTLERDATVAAREVTLIARRTILWGLLIVVIAAAFAYALSGRMVLGVMQVVAATRRLAAGELSTRVPSSRRDELGILAHAVNDMGKQISSLLSEQLEKARLARELDTAKIVQSSFLPPVGIHRDGLVVTGSYEPASECGGDWWGVHSLGEHHRLVCIADAMGHGVPAALVTAMAYAAVTVVAKQSDANATPAQFLLRLNDVIYQAYKGQLSMTCFVAVIDTRDGRMTYANAGHCFPLLMPGDTEDSRWRRNDAGVRPAVLRAPGIPLGIEPAPEFDVHVAELKPGDRLVFYTDGLVEARGAVGSDMWGTRALTEALASVHTADAATVHAHVIKIAKSFIGGRRLDDDITLVVVERPRDVDTVKLAS